MRPVDKTSFSGNKTTYKPFNTAKDDLITTLGSFCSYCERAVIYPALAVEHIENKDTYPDKECDWSNFLLACVNCNSIKGKKSVQAVLLPDRDNTFEVFLYLDSGFIQVKPNTGSTLALQAQALINLVRLDRIPSCNGYAGSDNLWLIRKEAWVLAHRYLKKYQENKCDIETLIDLALLRGFWSVWMQVFENDPAVQKALLNAFTGTNKSYFKSLLSKP